MSKYIQVPCVSCHSSDAFTIYKTGSTCFSCEFKSVNINQSTIHNLKDRIEEECKNCGKRALFKVDNIKKHPEYNGLYCNHCRSQFCNNGKHYKPAKMKKKQTNSVAVADELFSKIDK